MEELDVQGFEKELMKGFEENEEKEEKKKNDIQASKSSLLKKRLQLIKNRSKKGKKLKKK